MLKSDKESKINEKKIIFFVCEQIFKLPVSEY